MHYTYSKNIFVKFKVLVYSWHVNHNAAAHTEIVKN